MIKGRSTDRSDRRYRSKLIIPAFSNATSARLYPQMMSQCSVLLTSFSVWKTHQKTNSSDDLLLEMMKLNLPSSFHLLRQLPVNVPIAQEMAIGKIQRLRPQRVLCCGMAERRPNLTVEARAVVAGCVLQTSIDLKVLTAGLPHTEISNDAGRFVCNGLYYAILNYLQSNHPDVQCLFVHVPILTLENRERIIADFSSILERVLTI